MKIACVTGNVKFITDFEYMADTVVGWIEGTLWSKQKNGTAECKLNQACLLKKTLLTKVGRIFAKNPRFESVAGGVPNSHLMGLCALVAIL